MSVSDNKQSTTEGGAASQETEDGSCTKIEADEEQESDPEEESQEEEYGYLEGYMLARDRER